MYDTMKQDRMRHDATRSAIRYDTMYDTVRHVVQHDATQCVRRDCTTQSHAMWPLARKHNRHNATTCGTTRCNNAANRSCNAAWRDTTRDDTQVMICSWSLLRSEVFLRVLKCPWDSLRAFAPNIVAQAFDVLIMYTRVKIVTTQSEHSVQSSFIMTYTTLDCRQGICITVVTHVIYVAIQSSSKVLQTNEHTTSLRLSTVNESYSLILNCTSYWQLEIDTRRFRLWYTAHLQFLLKWYQCYESAPMLISLVLIFA